MEPTTNTSGPTLRDGSTLYYSFLFAEPAARERVIETLKLINVISTTLYDVSESQVAEKKIHWWHEELARLSKRTARHPAVVAVQEHLHSPNAVKACLSILSAAANERYSPMASEQDWQEMLIADYGARLSLVDHALGNNKPAAANQAAALGLGQTHRLSTLATRLQYGYSVFSDEHFAQFKITPEQLLNDQAKGAPLIHSALTQATTTLTQALTEMRSDKSQLHASLPIHIMTELRASQVNLWLKQKPNLLRESITLTPLRKFFITYRCKRRFTKLTNTAAHS